MASKSNGDQWRTPPEVINYLESRFGRIDKTTTQRAVSMYSTEALALKAMRREVVEKFLDEVVKIDARIKAAEAKNEQ